MRPRVLTDLTQLPASDRIPMIAEGLDLIHRHVTTLIDGIDALNGSQQAVVTQLAEEESAKALVLLDILRAGRRDQKAINRLTEAFYSHLARGIYADLVQMRPATFGETHKLVDSMRESHYLDGPNDVDWIFRNEVLQRRESSIYVDFVEYDEGRSWEDPLLRNTSGFGTYTPAARQVLDLHAAGCFAEDGLKVIQTTWADAEITDETPWHEAERRTREILSINSPGGHELEYRTIANWQFPLGSLDLRMKEIDIEVLKARQANWDPDGYGDDYV